MLGRSTVLPCSSPSTSFAATSTLRQPRRSVSKSISAALVTDTPRPKALESNGSRNGNGKVGEGGPTIINGQVRPASFSKQCVLYNDVHRVWCCLKSQNRWKPGISGRCTKPNPLERDHACIYSITTIFIDETTSLRIPYTGVAQHQPTSA